MRCPVCLAFTDEFEETCRSCGLSLALLNGIFKDVDLDLAPVTDAARTLALPDLFVVSEFLHDFHEAFPQLILMVYIGHYPGRMVVGSRETAFWLANHAHSTSYPSRDPRFTLMMYVDTQGKRAVLSAGYGFEEILEEEEMKRAMTQGRRCFRLGDYAQGIIYSLGALSSLLITKASTSPVQPVPAR